jgi:hypothetical protein
MRVRTGLSVGWNRRRTYSEELIQGNVSTRSGLAVFNGADSKAEPR